MESNIVNRIKLFENAETQYITPYDINPAASTPIKKEAAKLPSTPIAKPRHKKKKPVKTEQAEYVNAIPLWISEEQCTVPASMVSPSNYQEFDSTKFANDNPQAFDSEQPEYANFSYYPEFNSTQLAYDSLQAFDLPNSEYANLFPFGMSDTERIYIDPAEEWRVVKKKQKEELITKKTKKNQKEATPSIQLDLKNSEYANLRPLGTSDTEGIYLDPEGRLVTIKKKQTKKRPKKSTTKETPIEDAVQYAELDLMQSHYMNVLRESKLVSTSDTEYSHLGADNKLVSSNQANQNKVLSTVRKEQEKTELLKTEETAAPDIKSKTGLTRKKARNKPHHLGFLAAEFKKLKIQPIQEEPTLDDKFQALSSSNEVKQRDNDVDQSRFNFFAKRPKKLAQVNKKSASNTASMQNK